MSTLDQQSKKKKTFDPTVVEICNTGRNTSRTIFDHFHKNPSLPKQISRCGQRKPKSVSRMNFRYSERKLLRLVSSFFCQTGFAILLKRDPNAALDDGHRRRSSSHQSLQGLARSCCKLSTSQKQRKAERGSKWPRLWRSIQCGS